MQAAGLKRGVFIVMNPQNGEVLAMVSLPTYDDNVFADGITRPEYRKLLKRPPQAVAQPGHQRAAAAGLDLQAGDRAGRPPGPQDHAPARTS